MKDLRDRIAVVTGGASGMGLGMARAFADAGARIVLADIEAEPLEAAADGLRQNGADAIGVVCDVSDSDSVASLRDQALQAHGAVHVLCNNAGVGGGNPGAIWEQPPDEWDWVMGVNLHGVIYGIRHFVPAILESGGGHVVNTASMAGLIEGGGIYGVTKHAVVALSEAMLRDAQGRGLPLGVSVLCPGWVNTRIMQSERNRPEAPRPSPEAENPIAQQLRAFAEAQVRAGMDPDEVGRIVLQAIQDERFYILTHAWEEMIRNRMEHIVEGQNPEPLMPPGLGGN